MAELKWKSAQAEFETFWTGKSQYCYGFEDTRAAMGAAGTRRVFTKARPSDYLVTDNGMTFFAEVKSSQHPTSFNLHNIETEQWKTAIRVTTAFGIYLFFIRRESDLQWYRVPGAYMIHTWKQGRRIVRWTELEQFKRELNGH